MSKTVDELIGVYIEASNAVVWEAEKRGLCPMTLDMQRAGIAAVVRAVRDEFGRIMYPGDDWNRQGILEQFEVILGDAGNEKVAGGPTREDGPGGVEQAVPAVTPATAHAPAVCVWTDVGDAYRSACGRSHFAWTSRDGVVVCPECKAPIKFTEAQR